MQTIKDGDRVVGVHTRKGKQGTVVNVDNEKLTYGGTYWITVEWDDLFGSDRCLEDQVIKLI